MPFRLGVLLPFPGFVVVIFALLSSVLAIRVGDESAVEVSAQRSLLSTRVKHVDSYDYDHGEEKDGDDGKQESHEMAGHTHGSGKVKAHTNHGCVEVDAFGADEDTHESEDERDNRRKEHERHKGKRSSHKEGSGDDDGHGDGGGGGGSFGLHDEGGGGESRREERREERRNEGGGGGGDDDDDDGDSNEADDYGFGSKGFGYGYSDYGGGDADDGDGDEAQNSVHGHGGVMDPGSDDDDGDDDDDDDEDADETDKAAEELEGKVRVRLEKVIEQRRQARHAGNKKHATVANEIFDKLQHTLSNHDVIADAHSRAGHSGANEDA